MEMGEEAVYSLLLLGVISAERAESALWFIAEEGRYTSCDRLTPPPSPESGSDMDSPLVKDPLLLRVKSPLYTDAADGDGDTVVS